MFDMSNDIRHLVGGFISISCSFLLMYFSISYVTVWYIKFVPPFTPIAKLYGMRCFVKIWLLSLTIVEVRALRHPPPTATGLSLDKSFGSL